jgi:hypothetical protein
MTDKQRETEILWIENICRAHLEKAIAEERNPTIADMAGSVLYEIADEIDADFSLTEIEVSRICMNVMCDQVVKERGEQVEW